MSYHPRIESKEMGSFQTTRSRNSELWFVGCHSLEDAILGYLAKVSERYGAQVYAFAIEGNHIQFPARYPNANRASFMRDLNSFVARAIPRYVPQYPGGPFWGRRYSAEHLPGNDDVEEQFFYTVLQPVQDGLVEKISDYPGYNCFHDAVNGVKKAYKVIRWGEYNAMKRYNSKISIKDFTEIVYLEYPRLPGYEHLTQREYSKLMHEKLEQRRVKIVKERYAKGLGFMGPDKLRKVRPGSLPGHSKTSDRYTHRPRVLSQCPERRSKCKAWYFDIYFKYRESSRAYRAGNLLVNFPEGTYRPYISSDLPNTG